LQLNEQRPLRLAASLILGRRIAANSPSCQSL
jgi:hypothetical protein